VKHLFEVLVTVDVLAFSRVLQAVSLDVLPQSVDDDRPRLCVNAKQPRQTQVQLELHRLQHTCIFMIHDLPITEQQKVWLPITTQSEQHNTTDSSDTATEHHGTSFS